MCVIVHKNPNISMLKLTTLESMFDRNPNGAGLMWQETLDGPVHFKKGLMTWPDFRAFVKDLGGSNLERMRTWNVVVHFRLATHGSNREPILTQPFPVAGTWDSLSCTEGVVDAAVAHNGVFRGRYLEKAGNRWSAPQHDLASQEALIGPDFGWSDTMEWVEKILYPLYVFNPLDITSPVFNRLVDATIDESRIILVTRHGAKRFGHWMEYENCFVSNLNFMPPKEVSYYHNWYYEHMLGKKPTKTKKKPLHDDNQLAIDSMISNDHRNGEDIL
jgi:hypothetical protein